MILKKWRKKRAVSKYVSKVSILLKKDYGPSDSYTGSQIESTVMRYRLERKYLNYALFLFAFENSLSEFSDREDFYVYEDLKKGNLDGSVFDVSGYQGGGFGSGEGD
ncbi:DUF6559 family protein [Marinimicrobium alkaliphilum]|uniref:DUF6559 family protein n=1 Tax=Marinimicrobium alkaliphilum TaxID=2202654 RepID=UPI000DB9F6E7|nr:DUF6559 family protein [Marinimicrobium alkaliphilum]